MLETNTDNNSNLISLAKAAEITGYHQDYLGQLCRLGRLPARKVGRNWFTSRLALQSLNAQREEIVDETMSASESASEPPDAAVPPDLNTIQPELEQVTIISQVEDLPIAIRTLPTPVVTSNTVQNIATTFRIQALQREVVELRRMLFNLMAEVTRHSELLQGRNFSDLWRQQDSLKHSYISNFDFSPPYNRAERELREIDDLPRLGIDQKESDINWLPSTPRFTVITWISAAATLAILTFMFASLFTGQLLGQQQPVVTVYYHQGNQVLEPSVAGESTNTPAFPQLIPTNGGQSPSNVVQ